MLTAHCRFCAGTYQKILQAAAKPALEGAAILYQSKVRQIQTTNEDVGRVKVSTESGQTFEFDEIVVTAPLGWLKRHMDAFGPALTPELTKAVANVGYGCLEKVRGPVDWTAIG